MHNDSSSFSRDFIGPKQVTWLSPKARGRDMHSASSGGSVKAHGPKDSEEVHVRLTMAAHIMVAAVPRARGVCVQVLL